MELWNPFHERFKLFVILSTIGGFYSPLTERVVTSKGNRWCIWLYTRVILLFYCYSFTSPLYHLLFKAENTNTIVLDLMALTAGVQSHFRLVWFVQRKKAIVELFDIWDQQFEEDRAVHLKREEYSLAYCKQLMKNVLTWTVIAFHSLNSYIILEYFNEDKVFKAAPLLFEPRPQSPDYELMVTSWVIPCMTQPFLFGSLEMFLLLPLCWETGELSRLSHDIADCLKKMPIKPGDTKEPIAKLTPENNAGLAEVLAGIKNWILQHRKLGKYHSMVRQFLIAPKSLDLSCTFAAAVLIAYRSATENLPFIEKVACVGYFLPYLVFFLISCRCSDTLSKKSEDLFTEGFAENWSALPPDIKKSLLLLQLRTTRSFNIKAFKIFPIESATFRKVMSMSYSVANFLIAKR